MLQKHQCCIKILTSIVRQKEKDNTGDLATWRWLLMLFQELGPDGMSSEDTSIEDLETIYQPRILPWRRNIDDWLTLIKRERKKVFQTIYSSAGHAPRMWIRSTINQISTREPPPGLPKALYDPEWRKGLDNDYIDTVLCPDNKDFLWYVLCSAVG